MIGHLRNDLDIGNLVLGIDNEDRAGQELQLLDQHAIGVGEGELTVVRQGRHFDLFGAAPAALREGQVSADGENLNIFRKSGDLPGETLGLLGADAGIERGHHRDQPYLAGRGGEVYGPEAAIDHIEIRRLVTGLQYRSYKGQGRSLESHSAFSFAHCSGPFRYR